MFEHERVVIATGARSGLPIILAVHSTALGQAVGGCRLWHYPRWRDGLDDALRLSAAMTFKCAAAGLPFGGGKTVVALPRPDSVPRKAILGDVGDLIESLGGAYATGPDVGTTPEDMLTIREHTLHACCLPESAGGTGDSSPHTATGVLAAIEATCRHLFGSAELAGCSISVVGLGSVGGAVARRLAAAGVRLVVADIDPARRALADELDATWATPDEALTAPVDVLVPAALGGVLDHELVPRLRCTAIAGPANNQLADESVADELHERGIHWAPDYVVGAGGVAYIGSLELLGVGPDESAARVRAIGDRLATILATAEQDGIPAHHAAQRLVAERLRRARPSTVDDLARSQV